MLAGPKIIHQTTKQIVQIRERIRTAYDQQKKYLDFRPKSLEFQVGHNDMLRASPWKGVI